jgi:hypothetical protein
MSVIVVSATEGVAYLAGKAGGEGWCALYGSYCIFCMCISVTERPEDTKT